MLKQSLAKLTDEELAFHIKQLDAKARDAQSELAHARRLLKRRAKQKRLLNTTEPS